MRRALLCGMLICTPLVAAADLRDPTRPPLAERRGSAPREPGPILSAVYLSDTRHAAIFNGEFVRSGGTVGSYTIEAVLADGVRYRHAGRLRELRLPPVITIIKKPTTDPARVPSGAP